MNNIYFSLNISLYALYTCTKFHQPRCNNKKVLLLLETLNFHSMLTICSTLFEITKTKCETFSILRPLAKEGCETNNIFAVLLVSLTYCFKLCNE